MILPLRIRSTAARGFALLSVLIAVGANADAAKRIVSLNPSLTSILIELGARDRIVGVDDYSARLETSVAELPRVGGLFNPSLESIVALEPDAVVLVPSVEQRDLRARLRSLGVRVVELENHRFDQVLVNIEEIGALVGRESAARARVDEILAHKRGVERAVASLKRTRSAPSAVLVLQRDPLFVVGSENFIQAMVESVGVLNVGAEFSEPYPQVAMEWLIARSPEVLVDLSPEGQESLAHWERWPALTRGRVMALDPASISMPGPHLDRTLDLLARALWGDAIEELLDAESAR